MFDAMTARPREGDGRTPADESRIGCDGARRRLQNRRRDRSTALRDRCQPKELLTTASFPTVCALGWRLRRGGATSPRCAPRARRPTPVRSMPGGGIAHTVPLHRRAEVLPHAVWRRNQPGLLSASRGRFPPPFPVLEGSYTGTGVQFKVSILGRGAEGGGVRVSALDPGWRAADPRALARPAEASASADRASG